MEISGTNKKEIYVMRGWMSIPGKNNNKNASMSSLTLFKTQKREQYYGNMVKQGVSIM